MGLSWSCLDADEACACSSPTNAAAIELYSPSGSKKGGKGGGGRGRISSVLAIDLVAATRATERNRRKAMPQNQRAAACGLRKVAKKDFRKNGAIECRVLLAFIC